MVKLLEIRNKFQTFHSFRGNSCPYVFSTNLCKCSKTHLVSEMGTSHRDFWLFYKVCIPHPKQFCNSGFKDGCSSSIAVFFRKIMNESGAHLEAASVQTIGKLNEVLRAQ